jgi:hypothetical protein
MIGGHDRDGGPAASTRLWPAVLKIEVSIIFPGRALPSQEISMKKKLCARIGSGLLLGGLVALAPIARAGDHDLYDSLQEFHDSYRKAQAETAAGTDIYDSSGPTSSGGQMPAKSEDMKTPTSGAYPPSPWDELRKQLGPMGGEGGS